MLLLIIFIQRLILIIRLVLNMHDYQHSNEVKEKYNTRISKKINSIQDFANISENSYQHYNKQLSVWGESSGIYLDKEFPEVPTSLNLDPTKFQNREIIWQRPLNFLQKNLLTVYDEINPLDVQQGALGNCYFLAALSAIASRPSFIQRLFQTNVINKHGFYCLWLCINGKWELITLNDYFPVFKDNMATLFSKPNHDKIWVLLLEKAYAKIYKSYSNIESGTTLESFRDLTGAPTQSFFLNDSKQDKQKEKNRDVWKHLLKNHGKGYLMTASPNSEKAVLKGIVINHAYTILDIKEFEEIKLIRMRNPWGSNDFVGKWNQNSDFWSHSLKKQLDFKPEENGMFYMSYEEFLQSFESVNVCKIHENYYYTSKAYTLSTNPKHLIIEFKLEDDYDVYITFSQIDKRCYGKSESDYKPCSMILVAEKTYELIADNYGQKRDLSLHFKGKMGSYKLFFDLNNVNYERKNLQFRDDEEITISK